MTRFIPTKRLAVMACIAGFAVTLAATARAEHPEPSPYPISWELDFTHSMPQRIVVSAGNAAPRAYWYITYTVINNTDQEQTFLPVFELSTEDGDIHRSDKGVPYKVFEAIKKREGNEFLEHFTQVGGELLIGEDEAREGVAIWPEPNPEMGRFCIFVQGLSGEAVIMKSPDGSPMKTPDDRPVILRKTLQLNYFVRGDEVFPGEDEVNENPSRWVMR